ncbi:Ras-related protein Rab-10 [Strongyloides ratti]|uniref:Ras-related protein Rab-10 n=1 Tax=Strongyloides ratti TaxID=34506 RepID=A0A090N0R4_STRRB|nr:Ras-related protein Rab-10 [Strongyloides ratti]CEF71143.1 Ras-related protein Rab-10 [Strongyloides ratti]
MNNQITKKNSVMQDVDYQFSIMLLGDSCTGKTCLLIRYKDDTFMNSNFISTVGIDYRTKYVELNKYKIKLQIWDTAGQERFRSITNQYYRDADALLLVYDITVRSTFENIRNWLSQIEEFAKDGCVVTLVGNKADLSGQRNVSSSEGKELAKAYNINYIETSAKTGLRVTETFHDITKKLLIRDLSQDKSTDINKINLNSSSSSWYLSSCCESFSQ